jgi:hypothetical protein
LLERDYERVLWQVITGRKGCVAEIKLLHLRRKEGYKEPALFEGIRGQYPQD